MTKKILDFPSSHGRRVYGSLDIKSYQDDIPSKFVSHWRIMAAFPVKESKKNETNDRRLGRFWASRLRTHELSGRHFLYSSVASPGEVRITYSYQPNLALQGLLHEYE